MPATTYTHSVGGKLGASFKAGLVRLFQRIIEAREMQITGRVVKILRSYDDVRLKTYGYTSADIARLRQGKTL